MADVRDAPQVLAQAIVQVLSDPALFALADFQYFRLQPFALPMPFQAFGHTVDQVPFFGQEWAFRLRRAFRQIDDLNHALPAIRCREISSLAPAGGMEIGGFELHLAQPHPGSGDFGVLPGRRQKGCDFLQQRRR